MLNSIRKLTTKYKASVFASNRKLFSFLLFYNSKIWTTLRKMTRTHPLRFLRVSTRAMAKLNICFCCTHICANTLAICDSSSRTARPPAARIVQHKQLIHEKWNSARLDFFKSQSDDDTSLWSKPHPPMDKVHLTYSHGVHRQTSWKIMQRMTELVVFK